MSWEMRHLVFSLDEHHRVYLHKPKWCSLLHTWATRYNLMWARYICSPSMCETLLWGTWWYIIILGAAGHWNDPKEGARIPPPGIIWKVNTAEAMDSGKLRLRVDCDARTQLGILSLSLSLFWEKKKKRKKQLNKLTFKKAVLLKTSKEACENTISETTLTWKGFGFVSRGP